MNKTGQPVRTVAASVSEPPFAASSADCHLPDHRSARFLGLKKASLWLDGDRPLVVREVRSHQPPWLSVHRQSCTG